LAHSALHGIGTLIILAFWLGAVAWVYALADTVIHYHLDGAKMNAGKRYALQPDNSDWYWTLLVFNQLLRLLTYFALVAIAFKPMASI